MFVIDARQYGNVGRYLNHSCGPNCVVQQHLDDTWKTLESFYHPSNYGKWTVSASDAPYTLYRYSKQ